MNSLLVEWISINYLSTNGRIGRKEYILGIIFDYTILLLLLSAAIYGGRLEKYFFSLGAVVRAVGTLGFYMFFIIAYIRSICSTIRRLHDLDRPGSYYLMLFFPFYNIYLILLLLTQRGTIGRNCN